jgi:S-adenosylmethionine-dependent methyltransferase
MKPSKPEPGDRNFDDAVEHFEKNIYGSAKGAIRLAVMQDHLAGFLPEAGADKPPLKVLDAGCGLGQFGLELARQGHAVTFNDLSGRMLERVRERQREDPRLVHAPGIEYIHGPVQNLDAARQGRYDLILFHAVLEWLADPEAALHHLRGLLRPGGLLSLSFYNRDALVFRNLIRGNWRQAEREDQRGRPGGLTPYRPLTLDQVEDWIHRQGLEIRSIAGIRLVHDYLPADLRMHRNLEETIRIEKKFSRHPLYARLGRYLHLIIKKAG